MKKVAYNQFVIFIYNGGYQSIEVNIPDHADDTVCMVNDRHTKQEVTKLSVTAELKKQNKPKKKERKIHEINIQNSWPYVYSRVLISIFILKSVNDTYILAKTRESIVT